jgi:hypothetical protein
MSKISKDGLRYLSKHTLQYRDYSGNPDKRTGGK